MAEIDVGSLKPNSHKYKSEESEKERTKVKPLVSRNDVVSTKKSFWSKAIEVLVGDDLKGWILDSVIIPCVQNGLPDLLELLIKGEIDSGRSRRRDRDGRSNYRSCYRGSSSSRRERRRDRDDYYDKDEKVDCENIVLKRRDDAENVVREMRRRIRDNGSVSVAELLDMIDVPGKWTDNNYGWDDERDVGIRRVPSGFLIDVETPKYLD